MFVGICVIIGFGAAVNRPDEVTLPIKNITKTTRDVEKMKNDFSMKPAF